MNDKVESSPIAMTFESVLVWEFVVDALLLLLGNSGSSSSANMASMSWLPKICLSSKPAICMVWLLQLYMYSSRTGKQMLKPAQTMSQGEGFFGVLGSELPSPFNGVDGRD